MPNTDWGRLDDKQLERYAEYLLKAEFSSHGYDILPAGPGDARRFAVAAGARRFTVAFRSSREFKSASFPKDGTSLAVLAVFLDGKAPMLYMVPSQAWEKPDALLSSKGGKLTLALVKASMNLLANYGFDFSVRRLAKQ